MDEMRYRKGSKPVRQEQESTSSEAWADDDSRADPTGDTPSGGVEPRVIEAKGSPSPVWLALTSSPCTAISGEALAERLGVSRVAIWKQIRRLKQDGYDIQSGPQGYRLLLRDDGLLPEEIRTGLPTRVLGHHVQYRTVTPSTQLVARDAAVHGAPHGYLVVTETQTAGRGRRGRRWWAPQGGLWFSVVLRAPWTMADLPLVTGALGIAVVEALHRHGVCAGLKWPNDLWCGGRKLGGILLDVSGEPDAVHWAVVGIGINVSRPPAWPPDLIDTAIAVADCAPAIVGRRQLLHSVLEEMENWLARVTDDPAAVVNAWRRHDVFQGRRVAVHLGSHTYYGTHAGLTDTGGLLLRTPTGETVVHWGGELRPI